MDRITQGQGTKSLRGLAGASAGSHAPTPPHLPLSSAGISSPATSQGLTGLISKTPKPTNDKGHWQKDGTCWLNCHGMTHWLVPAEAYESQKDGFFFLQRFYFIQNKCYLLFGEMDPD